ncbi:MAG: hypothetical protein ACJ8E1_10535 [Xanthobacteraceae bacterium]
MNGAPVTPSEASAPRPGTKPAGKPQHVIATAGGYEYTGAECMNWMRESGFGEMHTEALGGTHAAVVGIK